MFEGMKINIKYVFDLSRVYEHLVKNKSFGIVSAYKKELSEAENEIRAELMKEYIREVLKYGFKEIYGVWQSKYGTVTIKYYLFIPNLTCGQVISLANDEYLPKGERHPQDCIIVGDGSKISLISMDYNLVKAKWNQTETDWREMWKGWSEYKGNKFRFISVIWGMRELPEAISWGSSLARNAYKSPTSYFDFSEKEKEQIKKLYGAKKD